MPFVKYRSPQGRRSSTVEQWFCKPRAGGSIPLVGSPGCQAPYEVFLGRYPSGQRGQAVNLMGNPFRGSNPLLPTIKLI